MEGVSLKALVVLTPSESKRLIAKAVASMGIVKDALKNGILVIIKGTTNSYVAEEILGRKIDKDRYARGIVIPERLTGIPGGSQIPDIILEKGKVREDLVLGQAGKGTHDVFEILKAGDVIIKGANALDPNWTAGIYLGDPYAGTIGLSMRVAFARGIDLIIPVGLEKLVPTPIKDFIMDLGIQRIALSMGSKIGMMPVPGTVVTELEAFKILTGVEALNIGAGGVAGAEGARVFLLKGDEESVKKAYSLAESIKGEPPYKPIATG